MGGVLFLLPKVNSIRYENYPNHTLRHFRNHNVRLRRQPPGKMHVKISSEGKTALDIAGAYGFRARSAENPVEDVRQRPVASEKLEEPDDEPGEHLCGHQPEDWTADDGTEPSCVAEVEKPENVTDDDECENYRENVDPHGIKHFEYNKSSPKT